MYTADSMNTAEMRWAAPPSRWSILASALQPRLLSNLATALDLALGPRSASAFAILMYHRIAPPVRGLPAPTINVTPQQFRRQLEGLLRRGFTFWPLQQVLAAQARGETIPANVIVLTFDDGFASVLLNALPILKQLNIPATIFINTGFLDSRSPFPFDHWAVAYHSRAPLDSYRCLTRDECRQLLAQPLIELGAHTHTHQDFRGRAEEFRQDLKTCLDALRTEFGIGRPTFAFPYGTPHLGFAAPELMAAARTAGVQCALTTESTLVQSSQSPFGWGRLNVFPWDTAATIAARVHGWYCWAPRLQRRVMNAVRQGFASRRTAPPTTTVAAPTCPAPKVRVSKPLISVIVPTFNRAHWLGDAIDSLVQQETDDQFHFEIIVVDNGSSDNTRGVVAAAADRSSVPVHYLLQTKPGDAPARNAGVSEARGEWLAFFDDDQFASRTWLAELLNAAQATGALIVGGPVHLDLTDDQLRGLGPICRRALREIQFYSRLQPYQDRDLPGTGNSLVAASVFHRVGLFDETMTGGGSDSDLFLRARQAGIDLWYTPHAVIRHRIPPERLSREYFRWDALSGGAGYAELIDYKQGGLPRVLAMCTARLAQALLLNLPLVVLAQMRGDAGEALGRRTLLWRAEGYGRQTLKLAAPRLFPQRAFFEFLDFRKGRVVGQQEQKNDSGPSGRSTSDRASVLQDAN